MKINYDSQESFEYSGALLPLTGDTHEITRARRLRYVYCVLARELLWDLSDLDFYTAVIKPVNKLTRAQEWIERAQSKTDPITFIQTLEGVAHE